jgi:hypothetical protein
VGSKLAQKNLCRDNQIAPALDASKTIDAGKTIELAKPLS